MKSLDFGRYVLSACVAVVMLAGCGGLQPPVGTADVLVTGQRNGVRQTAASLKGLTVRVTDAPNYKFSGPLLFVTNSDPDYTPVTIYEARENDPKPIATITKGIFEVAGDCVDSDGTLYVVDQGNAVREYALGKIKPFQIITKGLWTPAFCAIDPAGSLWVTNLSAHYLTEYKKGSTKPHRIPKDGLTSPDGIAIDHAGNIYVGNLEPSGPSNIQVYQPGRKKPVRTITDGVRWPVGIAVDAKGTLYVTNLSAPCNIEEYRAGKSHPYREITDQIYGPVNVTFSKNGWLYVADEPVQGCGNDSDPVAILEFPPNSVKPSHREILRDLDNPIGVAYYPPLLP
jgi:hypothetical protein